MKAGTANCCQRPAALSRRDCCQPIPDVALAHWPRFVIYNGLNALGEAPRGVRTRPNRPFTVTGTRANRGGNANEQP